LENSPLVIHEAFRAGVPVVGARIGGIPDLVIDGVNGLLFDAGSASSLARTLRRLLDEPGLAAALASRAPAVKTLAADIAEWDARYVVAAARAAVPA
jgi:glycosyltransferase involved in cell wall biosynthesis